MFVFYLFLLRMLWPTEKDETEKDERFCSELRLLWGSGGCRMGYFRVLHLIHMCGGLATYIISIVGWDGCRERHGKGLFHFSVFCWRMAVQQEYLCRVFVWERGRMMSEKLLQGCKDLHLEKCLLLETSLLFEHLWSHWMGPSHAPNKAAGHCSALSIAQKGML